MIRRKPTPEPKDCIVIESALSPAEIVAVLTLITGDGVPLVAWSWIQMHKRVYYANIFKGEVTEERLWLRELTARHYLYPMVSARMSVVNDSTRITLSWVEQNYLTQMRWIVVASSVPIYTLFPLKRILVREITHSKKWVEQELLVRSYGELARNPPARRIRQLKGKGS